MYHNLYMYIFNNFLYVLLIICTFNYECKYNHRNINIIQIKIALTNPTNYNKCIN